MNLEAYGTSNHSSPRWCESIRKERGGFAHVSTLLSAAGEDRSQSSPLDRYLLIELQQVPDYKTIQGETNPRCNSHRSSALQCSWVLSALSIWTVRHQAANELTETFLVRGNTALTDRNASVAATKYMKMF
jgi:hypothetical protein